MALTSLGWKSSVESVVPVLVVGDMVSYAACKCTSGLKLVCWFMTLRLDP